MSQTSLPESDLNAASFRFDVGDAVNFTYERETEGSVFYIIQEIVNRKTPSQSSQDLDGAPYYRIQASNGHSFAIGTDYEYLYLVSPLRARVTKALEALEQTSEELGLRLDAALARQKAAADRREYGIRGRPRTQVKPTPSTPPPARRASKLFDNAF